MTIALILWHYNPLYKSILEIDTSNSVITGILSQLHPDSEWHLVAYFSKTIAPAKYNYEIYNKEMLAIIWSLL
jgi:hypothetical protein